MAIAAGIPELPTRFPLVQGRHQYRARQQSAESYEPLSG
jgi:hypothetical protein